jgi:hypothetical protein
MDPSGPGPHLPGGEPPQGTESTSFSSFDRLLHACRRTRAVLVAVARDQAAVGDGLRDVLASEALAHVNAVLDGLTLLARAGSFSQGELRELVRRAGIVERPRRGTPEAFVAQLEAAAERTMDERGLAGGPAMAGRRSLRAVDGQAMLAAGHARVVFSIIPRLPPEAVAWPLSHGTYADIPVPRTEAELLVRAEELARVLWRIAAGDARRDEALRRTLAFYEAGSRLSVSGAFRAA